MTDTASAGTDVTAESSSAPQTGDTETESPTVTPEKSGRERIAERAKELRKPKGAAQAQTTDAQQSAESGKNAGDADAQGDESKDKGEETEPKPIPFKAFQERLARESKKAQALRDQMAGKDLELSKGREALNLAVAEVDRLRGLLQQGAQFDPRDEELHGMRLAETARQTRERIESEHKGNLEKASNEARVAAIREQLTVEVDSSLAKYRLIDRSELVRALQRAGNEGRDVEEVAAELHAIKLETAKSLLVPTKPATPSTVNAQRGGGGSTVRYSNDRQGVRERIAALRGQTG